MGKIAVETIAKTAKKAGQSVTGILVFFIVVGSGLLLGWLFRVFGITAVIDSLWLKSKEAFWITTLISRGALIAIWFFGDSTLVEVARKADWLWFRAENHYLEKEPSVDKSVEIVSFMIATLIALVITEAVIRFTAWNLPPFLPKPEL